MDNRIITKKRKQHEKVLLLLFLLVSCSCQETKPDYRDSWIGEYRCIIVDDEGARIEAIDVEQYEFCVFVDKALESMLLVSAEQTKGPVSNFPIPHINATVGEDGHSLGPDFSNFEFSGDSIYVRMYLGSAHGAEVSFYLNYCGPKK